MSEEIGFYDAVVRLLVGEDPELGDPSLDRLDWAGVSAVLRLYEQTEGAEREAVIRALGRIIEDGRQEPFVVAQVLDLASSLDLSQVQPSVRRLGERALAAEEPVRGALDNYLAFRRLRTSSARPTRQAVGVGAGDAN